MKTLHYPTMTVMATTMISITHELALAQEARILCYNRIALGGEATIDSSPCPYLVGFYDGLADIEGKRFYVAMEYMNAGSLKDILSSGRRIPETVLAVISYRVLRGLHFLHTKRIIHLDVRPSNILFNRRGEVKLSGFGIPRMADDDTRIREDAGRERACVALDAIGSMFYMSPERLEGNAYGLNVDVWALGISILSCALGHHPLENCHGYQTLMRMTKEDAFPPLPLGLYSSEFCDVLRLMLTRNPEMRPDAANLLEHPFFKPLHDLEIGQTTRTSVCAWLMRELRGHQQIDLQPDQVVRVIDKVVRSRYFRAVAAKEPRLPRLPLDRMFWFATQMGADPTAVEEAFCRIQTWYDAKLAK
jgi:serine/threonine protein kinase